jgi:predicted dithiol-disulfide oxidoreductase (DUF899 family)
MQPQMQPSKSAHPKVGSEKEWLAARKELLAAEKEFTRQRDALSAKRRKMPWLKVDKKYVFDSRSGKVSLSDLFRDKSQLVVYHFMLGPGWEQGCPGCSFLGDHFDGALPHLNARDVAFSAISRAAMSEIQSFKDRMGWYFPWVSSNQNDFNFDYHVSFTKDQMSKGKVQYNYAEREFPSEEAPGLSVFYKNAAGEIFHSRPKAATKRPWRVPWSGFVITTAKKTPKPPTQTQLTELEKSPATRAAATTGTLSELSLECGSLPTAGRPSCRTPLCHRRLPTAALVVAFSSLSDLNWKRQAGAFAVQYPPEIALAGVILGACLKIDVLRTDSSREAPI